MKGQAALWKALYIGMFHVLQKAIYYLPRALHLEGFIVLEVSSCVPRSDGIVCVSTSLDMFCQALVVAVLHSVALTLKALLVKKMSYGCVCVVAFCLSMMMLFFFQQKLDRRTSYASVPRPFGLYPSSLLVS